MSKKFDYDLFVIGGGSGGVRAARMFAATGKKVAIAEDRHWGGTCVNVGCVPKKLLVFASHYAHDFEDSKAYGWNLDAPTFDWHRLIENKNREIERLNGIYVRLLENTGVDLLNGHATISGRHSVALDGKEYSAERILIAVGGQPFVPDVPGAEHAIESDKAFYLDELPASICIVGGGYIACEFACIFNGMGAKVTQVYRGEEILRGFEDDLRKHLHAEMTKQGINVLVEEDVRFIAREGDLKRVELNSGKQLEVDQIFYATGRVPRTQGLWSDDLNIRTNARGEVEVDDCFQSTEPGIYALGDVVGRMPLTPVATAEAMALVNHFQTGESFCFDYQNIPSAVFTTPNLATVGLTETQAFEKGIDFQVYETDFRHLKHTLTGRDERVYFKLIVEKNSDRVIGAHMMGPEAGEVIQSVAVAIKAGATKAIFDQTIGIHPTMAEELVTLRQPRD